MIRHMLMLSLMILQPVYAATVVKETVDETLLLKGQLTSIVNHSIYNLHDAVLTPLPTKGQYVHAGEDVFVIDDAKNTRQILGSIQAYFKADIELKLYDNQLAADRELFQAKAISFKKIQESELEYKQKQLVLIQAQDTLEEDLKRFNKTLDDIHLFKSMSINDIYQHIQENMPQTIQASTSGYFLPESEQPKFFEAKKCVGNIINHDSFIATIELNEYQVNKVKKDHKVMISVPSVNRKVTGYVHHVVPYPMSDKGTPLYEAVVYIDQLSNDDQAVIKNGMECIASVVTSQQNSLIIPLSAVKNIANSDFVIVKRNNQQTLEPVTLGATSGMNVVVLSGLNEGDEIIEHH